MDQFFLAAYLLTLRSLDVTGSVVLVLLTRINENGQELCHKYWPEEGSQLYHIYEVRTKKQWSIIWKKYKEQRDFSYSYFFAIQFFKIATHLGPLG